MRISGTAEYALVEHNASGSLNHDSEIRRPIRGATVQAINGSGATLASSTTNDNGQYELVVDQNTSIRVRVLAELLQEGTPNWDFSVTDNTDGNSLYALQGSLVSSGTADSTRDLFAASGWGSTSYTGSRTAAPFAILDSVKQALDLIVASDPDVSLVESQLRWSTNNRAAPGNTALGEIGTSHYNPNENNMYILGDDDSDTDEFDRSVIQHELFHYLEDTLSRSDSIGGSHSGGQQLDMRVAFSEGVANGFTAIASGEAIYQDSFGSADSGGFTLVFEPNSYGNKGWYSEDTVGRILFDLYDDDSEIDDDVSLGFTPLYNAFVASSYRESDSAVTIFLFLEELAGSLESSVATDIENLADIHGINGTNEWGLGESNEGSESYHLPVYHSLTPNNTVNVCTTQNNGRYNALSNRRFIRLTIPSDGVYEFIASESGSATGATDPDINVFYRGSTNSGGVLSSSVIDIESGNLNLDAGVYVIEVHDYQHVSNDEPASGNGTPCFNVRVNS